jgi:SAM-dependent methyltransferase
MTTSVDAPPAPVSAWLDDRSLEAVYSAQSWNDLAEERLKEWWIADGTEEQFARLRSYLDETGSMQDYRIAEDFVARLPATKLAIADLAAGVGWTSSLLSRLPNVGSVHAVDISRHRLELLFPQAIRMFQGDATKLQRSIGSFYELGFSDSSMDVALLSAAFHHASNPLRLLSEIDRVLKPSGHLIMIGENVIGPMAIMRRMARKLLLERRLCTNFYELFPPDHSWGDHYYRVSDYFFLLQLVGYTVVKFSVQKKQTATVIAVKDAAGSALPANTPVDRSGKIGLGHE